MLGRPEQPSSHKYIENLILLVLAIVPAILIYKFYVNWPGAISVDEHQRDKRQKRPIIYLDAADEVRRLIHGEKRAIHRSAATQPVFLRWIFRSTHWHGVFKHWI